MKWLQQLIGKLKTALSRKQAADAGSPETAALTTEGAAKPGAPTASDPTEAKSKATDAEATDPTDNSDAVVAEPPTSTGAPTADPTPPSTDDVVRADSTEADSAKPEAVEAKDSPSTTTDPAAPADNAGPATTTPAAEPTRADTATQEAAAEKAESPATSESAEPDSPAEPATAEPTATNGDSATEPESANPALSTLDNATRTAELQAEGPYGPGSATPSNDGTAPTADYVVKAKESSKLFHSEKSPYFGRTKADVWFKSEADAESAGFQAWDHKKRAAAKK